MGELGSENGQFEFPDGVAVVLMVQFMLSMQGMTGSRNLIVRETSSRSGEVRQWRWAI